MGWTLTFRLRVENIGFGADCRHEDCGKVSVPRILDHLSSFSLSALSLFAPFLP